MLIIYAHGVFLSMYIGNLKILEKALQWKQMLAAASEGSASAAVEEEGQGLVASEDVGSSLGKRSAQEMAADEDAIDIDDI